MKKAIITGANSFIGYRLCKILAENGYFVYAIIRRDNDNNDILNQSKNLKLIYAEMKDYNRLDEFIHEKCDVGITLAWNGTRGADRNNEAMQKENFDFSLACIDSFIRLGCKKILTAGSQAEYGTWFESRKVAENDECHPNTEYGKYKLAFYNKALEICVAKNITLIEPRYFSLYGDDDSEKTMIISMVRNMLQNKPCELTECKQLWDFLYIDDAIEALYRLIESKNANGIYNFGSGVSKPLKDFVLKMKELTESSSDLLFGSVSYPPIGIVNINPNIAKLRKEIGWKPKISFDEGIKKCISFLKTGIMNKKFNELTRLDKSAYVPSVPPVFPNNNSAIVFESSGIYAPYLDVALSSLIENSSDENFYDIIVLSNEIDKIDCNLINKQIDGSKNISLRFYDPSEIVREYIQNAQYKYLDLNYYRLALPWILDKYEKALNLGVDIVIKKDVAELLNCKMTDSEYLAGVIDLGYIGRLSMDIPQGELGLKNPEGYINADVLVLNNKNIRRDFSIDFILGLWQKYEFRCAEQDAFNVLFQNHIHYLDLKWNVFPRRMASIEHIAHNSDKNIELWRESLKDPYIIHFAAYPKAWYYPTVEFAELWWHYARKSPYYEELLRRMILANRELIYSMPQKISFLKKLAKFLLKIFLSESGFLRCKKIYQKLFLHSEGKHKYGKLGIKTSD